MKIHQRIFDFILFRVSFEIETRLGKDQIKSALADRFYEDRSFLDSIFEEYEFAFSHKNFMPETYGFSPIYFEGEIESKTKTLISVQAKSIRIFIGIFIFAVATILISNYTDLGDVNDKLANVPLDINPLTSLLALLIPYFYYAIKIYDVKNILRDVVRFEEKRARTIAKMQAGARSVNKTNE